LGFYEDLRVRFRALLEEHGLSGDQGVQVLSASSLSPREAIGDPGRDDFLLLRGREVMVEAPFGGSRGQAHTDEPGEAVLSLGEILDMPAETSFRRAVLISPLNAAMRYPGMAKGTAVNGTFGRLAVGRRTIFYGVSVAGIAELYGLERFCPFGR